MKTSYLIVVAFVCFFSSCVQTDKAGKNIKLRLNEITPVPDTFGAVSKGVSACFAGFLDNQLIVAGGCNFPDTAAAEGGRKVFYKDILGFDGKNWKKTGELPNPVAYGVSVNLPHALVCIGGRNNDSFYSSVLIIKINKQGKAVIDSLPSLPASFDNCGGALLDSVLYVFGGNQNKAPSNAMWSFDLRKKNGWQACSPAPSRPLMQPVVVAAAHSVYVFGGYDNAYNIEAENSKNDLKYIPAEVSQAVWKFTPENNRWTCAGDFPAAGKHSYSLSGGAGAAISDSLILTFGGVNKSVFEEALNRNLYLAHYSEKENPNIWQALDRQSKEYMFHPKEWYQFNPKMMLFNTRKNRWSSLYEFPETALAGATVAINDREIFVINGEIKPGIRTPGILKITIQK